MKVDFDIECFDDGNNWRHSGSFTVDGVVTTVEAGTIDLEEMVVEAVEAQLGRPLTEEEVETVSDAVYLQTDFEFDGK